MLMANSGRAWWWPFQRRRFSTAALSPPADDVDTPDVSPEPFVAGDTDSLVDSMLRQHRHALLLRRQIAASLTAVQYARAREEMERQMAIVPAGRVDLWPSVAPLNPAADTADQPPGSPRQVRALFLDRYPVTNLLFYEFVRAGGYEQTSLWDAAILPGVLDFVDATGDPGPRYWKNGRYPAGSEHHPVVGVSWYEAVAYARWVGKRLPSDAEWVKAGSWPVPLSDERQWQRKFPWGDTMDRDRCNLWGSGRGATAAVTDDPAGVSVGGVYQLIGNVWEWTTGDFGADEGDVDDLSLPTPMKSIRGGAFDTYFENQATCQFVSGESPLARRHNIGFRCALGVCDVAPSPRQAAEERECETSDAAAEEGESPAENVSEIASPPRSVGATEIGSPPRSVGATESVGTTESVGAREDCR
jgi:gamma-glutamyl hercynylcysteine S-oxide synthase